MRLLNLGSGLWLGFESDYLYREDGICMLLRRGEEGEGKEVLPLRPSEGKKSHMSQSKEKIIVLLGSSGRLVVDAFGIGLDL